MAAKKKKITKVSKTTNQESGELAAAAGILFAGVAVVLLGNIQDRDNIKLLLIGFGAALLVLGGVLVGMCTKPTKSSKKK